MHVFGSAFGFGAYVKALLGCKAFYFSVRFRFGFGVYVKWPLEVGIVVKFLLFYCSVISCRFIIPRPEVIKLFSCSTQLSTKFQLLIKNKIPKGEEVSCFKSLRCGIYHANKC